MLKAIPERNLFLRGRVPITKRTKMSQNSDIKLYITSHQEPINQLLITSNKFECLLFCCLFVCCFSKTHTLHWKMLLPSCPPNKQTMEQASNGDELSALQSQMKVICNLTCSQGRSFSRDSAGNECCCSGMRRKAEILLFSNAQVTQA